ncbi:MULTISPECIES: adenylate/guanylate cyclase domain-containing protein [Leptospira]|uniref:adenylate/guanylate cyclase domain-containing protein n=1 Tax=Leptospira TaxID=171 RepID=UPI00214C0AD5|nr:adenylate/guanylate cyclase domain-containing protein [Leptospira sp. id769339]MCR1795694.1 adenylate/guanylate cyclase domain-containing protein [Leptospira sp. id769339]
MKIFGKETKAHLRVPTKQEIFVTLIGLLLTSFLHASSFNFGDVFWQSITLRLYYLPVIYGAASSGMVLGFAGGCIAAFSHFIVMQAPMTHNDEYHFMMQMEHHLEIPFLIFLGLITGAIRDHEKHENEQKRHITTQFGSYVSEEIRDDILSGNIQLGGIEVEATILFADIRNFTSISEKHSPAQVVSILNQYFTEMVYAVAKYGGTINKFIGDSIMVVFGAPKHYEDHAKRAILVGLEMLRRLEAHNYLQITKNEPTFDIGIGIHTGNVIAGNIGSDARKEYTVIGDSVNLASRIEGLTKEYEISLLISDSVKKKINEEEFFMREIDIVIVKGRTSPCSIYEIIGRRISGKEVL